MQFFQEMIEAISNFQFLDPPKEAPPAFSHVHPTSMLIEGTSQGYVSSTGSLIYCHDDTPKSYWTARSNSPIHATPSTSFHFEITIHSLPDGVVALGLCTRDFPTSRALPGWLALSYGYHSDDGGIFAHSGEKANTTWRKFGPGDVVGCGLEGGKVYFTHNKAKLETSLRPPPDLFYLTVGMSRKCSWSYNFGLTPFVSSGPRLELFRLPSAAQVNHSHPFLSLPHCIWPFLVGGIKGKEIVRPVLVKEPMGGRGWTEREDLNKTIERHQTWQALLCSCKALQEYLLPLFCVLSRSDYYHALSGYHFSCSQTTDTFIEIHNNKVTVIKKCAYEMDLPNTLEEKTAEFTLEREVIRDDRQRISVTSAGLGDWRVVFEFERYQPLLLENTKCTKEEYESRLKEHKNVGYPSLCGAAVVTPGAPCCHDAIRGMALEVFRRIPRESVGYNEVMLGMSEVVENLAQECMSNAMTQQEIHKRITQNLVRIAPHLANVF